MTALSVMRLLPDGGHITGGTIMLDGTEHHRAATTRRCGTSAATWSAWSSRTR